MADAADLKSAEVTLVWVRIPPFLPRGAEPWRALLVPDLLRLKLYNESTTATDLQLGAEEFPAPSGLSRKEPLKHTSFNGTAPHGKSEVCVMSIFSSVRRWQSGLALTLLLLALFSAPVLALDKVHVVQRGETLVGIARQFDISISQLAAYNGIDNTDFIFVGQKVLVPVAEAAADAPPGTHTVTIADSLSSIAAAYDTTVEKLLAINGLGSSSQIWVGQHLLVPMTQQPRQPAHHRVQLGETLSSIARTYGLNWQSLAIYNGLKDAGAIKFGQTLAIPSIDTSQTLTGSPTTTKPAPQAAVVPPAAPSTQTYVMRLGESLSTVALKFDVSLADLLEVNDLALDSHVWVGQNLRLPLRVDGSEPEAMLPYVAPGEPAASTSAASVALPVVTSGQSLSPPSSFLHIVKPGETLAKIAGKYEVDPNRVYEFNALAARSLLEVGQRLQIPLDLAGDPGFLGRRWVEIDLSEQILTAWDGDELFLQTDISSGLDIYPTPVGLFRIWHMNPSQTMSGPGYSLDNVKHNMYFFSGYAMHGAYWHNNFGTPMSHGCVNMPEDKAEMLYHFASLGMEVWVHH